MHKNKFLIIFFILVLLMLTQLSGCIDYLNYYSDMGTTYESGPTKIRYDIRYGYIINISGTGGYNVFYNCDQPEVLSSLGSVYSEILYEKNYSEVDLAGNSIIQWNISDEDDNDYMLGIRASVLSEGYIITDLNGGNALTIEEIKTLHPDLVSQYCKSQSNETTVFIEPKYIGISNTANSILNNAGTNNSFILAKYLFIWLKQETTYSIHTVNSNVQPASLTYQLKTGDCDDLSFLYISLCRSLGIPARFVKGYLLDDFQIAVGHAWAEVFVGGNIGNEGWIPVECACTTTDIDAQVYQNFGVENAYHLRLFTDDGSNESLNLSISGPRVSYDSGLQIDAISFVDIENYTILEISELSIDKYGKRSYE